MIRTRLFICAVGALALGLVSVGNAFAGTLDGRWSGSFNITMPDGSTKDDTAVLDLATNGSELTGRAGSDASHQYTIEKGKVDGDNLTFDLNADGMLIHFTLQLVDGRLTGDAIGDGSGPVPKAKLDLRREAEAPKP